MDSSPAPPERPSLVAPPPGPSIALEFALPIEASDRLHRAPPLARLGAGPGRPSDVELIWHDTPDGALAADGLSLCERRVGRQRLWRLERMRGQPGAPWPPGTPAPLVAEAALLAGLGHELPAPLLPVAACSGTLRVLPIPGAPITVSLLRGALRAVAGERPVCRLLLAGPPQPLAELVLALADLLPLAVPAVSLAAEAHATAGRAPRPPALGAPALPSDIDVADAFAEVTGHLTFVLLHWAPLAAHGAQPEPVHQMRVALRRLRSAIKLFASAIGGAELDAAGAALRALSHVLGPARDWDVFCAGTARTVAAQFPQERSIARLIAAAERQRRAAYTALAAHLASPEFRLLGIRLACLVALRPWEFAASLPDVTAPSASDSTAKQAALRAAPLADFAARALSRRLGHMRPPEGAFAELPADALHKLRIQAKRLRYAAEFFEPLFPRKETRRFLRSVGALQERLGHLNDGTVAEALMASLGGSGSERAMAVGIVRGFISAGARKARDKSERNWRKVHRLEPFWQ